MIYIEALEGICRWDRDLGIMTLEPKSVMIVQELQRIVQIRSICIWWQLLCGFFFFQNLFSVQLVKAVSSSYLTIQC